MTDNISALGFNGEYLDDTLDNYHLGNGYRAYNPSIMAFTAPDDMSPFGHGGINPYMYVSGDPINNTDPTGHFAGFLGAIIGIINMVLPLQVPTSLSVAGIEEAVMGTVVNVGVDLATDGLGAVATPVLRTVEGVARSTADHVIENVGQHAIISGTPTSHETRYMDKLLNWVYEKPENQRDYYSWLHDTTHQSDAPGPSRVPSNKEKPLQRIKKSVMEAKNGDEFQQFITTGRAPETKGKEVHAFVFTHEQKRYIASSKYKCNFFKNASKSTLVKEGNLLEIRGEEWVRRYREDGRFTIDNNNYANVGKISVFSDPS